MPRVTFIHEPAAERVLARKWDDSSTNVLTFILYC
jgi:hypothetical protein